MRILDKVKKIFKSNDEKNFIFKLDKYKVKKCDSVKEFPNKLSNFFTKGNIGYNFYVTLYKCPCCKSNPIYKTEFPIGKEYKITTTKGFIYMEEVFTCPNCYTIFTPLQDENFDYGEVFTIKLNTEKEYIDYILPLNIFGSLEDSI